MSTRHWKIDFLSLKADIHMFLDAHVDDDVGGRGNVIALLRHHLLKVNQLLAAHVNGRLDDDFKEEFDALTALDHENIHKRP